jgi:CheY-like chemotaxis protein
LYVEDDELVREEVLRTLRRIFKEVHVAKDGEEGLEAFKTLHPHMVIPVKFSDLRHHMKFFMVRFWKQVKSIGVALMT